MRTNARILSAMLLLATVVGVAVTVTQAPPAAAAGHLQYLKESVTQAPSYPNATQTDILTTRILCPASDVAVDGGALTGSKQANIVESEPFTSADGTGDDAAGLFAQPVTNGAVAWRGWSVTVQDVGEATAGSPLTYTVYAVCLASGSGLGPVTSVIAGVDASNASSTSVAALCPGGMDAIGGGFVDKGEEDELSILADTPVTASSGVPSSVGPQGAVADGTAWLVHVKDNDTASDPAVSVPVEGVVECVAPTSGRLFLMVQTSGAPAGGFTVVDAECPAGSGLVGGGATDPGAAAPYEATFTPPAGLTELSPTFAAGSGYEAAAISSSPITVAAVCYDPVSLIHRLSGATRINTAVFTSQDEYPGTGQASGAVIATGYGSFADALAGVPLAHKIGGPLLLTEASTLDPATAAELQRAVAPGSTVYVLGGPAALDPSIDASVQSLGFTVVRIAGANRFQTAAMIATQGLGSPKIVFEATGLDFPDALAAGAAAAKVGGAILLTDGTSQSSDTAAYLAAGNGVTRYAVGGEAAAADPAATPLVGADRFATAVAVASQFFTAPTSLGVASGLNFPDALSGGVDAALHGGPMLLATQGGALPGSTQTYLASIGAGLTSGYLYGGQATVGDDVASELDAATGQDPPPDPPTSAGGSSTTTAAPTTTTTLFGQR